MTSFYCVRERKLRSGILVIRFLPRPSFFDRCHSCDSGFFVSVVFRKSGIDE
jgi:hypothetical protein